SALSGTFSAQNAGVTVYLTRQTSTTTQTQTITRTINYLDWRPKRGRDGLLNPPNVDHDANTDHHPDD
ncbi:hypothetical protein, partial [Limosilactobacillus fermentum]|uniref:hypothetical protein n=1 Tax=Limosilactobacillus fermentum TaxID=1613 RepID=UPI001C9E6CAB